MSIYGALFAGVSGLRANSLALGVISDNIANVNTIGYKRNTTDFTTLVTGTGSGSAYSPGGVKSSARSLMEQQGLLQGTSSATDIAVAGDGFFVVSPQVTSGSATDKFLFTRAGSFTTDASGNLRNAAGFYLQGWAVATDGSVSANPSDLTQLQTINLGQLGGTAEPTTELTLSANLLASQAISADEATYDPTASATNMASGAVTPDFVRSVQVFDSKGGFRTVSFSFLKSSTPNEWHAEVFVEPASDVVNGAGLLDGQVATGTVAFTPSGLLDSANTSASLLNLSFLASGTAPGAGQVAWATSLGIDAQDTAVDLGGSAGTTGGFTQFDSPSNLISSQVNGAVFGGLAGVNIDKEGYVTALFDNGIQRKIYQLPIATFVNPAGLSAVSGNAYTVTNDSGPFNLKVPQTGGAGAVESQALEASTVDIAEEFTGLITTQRAYSANTRIITTADEMLQELIQIKR